VPAKAIQLINLMLLLWK